MEVEVVAEEQEEVETLTEGYCKLNQLEVLVKMFCLVVIRSTETQIGKYIRYSSQRNCLVHSGTIATANHDDTSLYVFVEIVTDVDEQVTFFL